MKFLSRLPEALLREVEASRAAVVGGAIREEYDGTNSSDIDIFVFSKENYRNIVTALKAVEAGGSDGHIHRVVNGPVPIEVIFEESHCSAQSCVDLADFDIASGVYCAGQLLSSERFREATTSRQMYFIGSDDPQRSYFRYLKYNKKYGYRIHGESLRRLLDSWKKSTSL
jgi:hypothetical protein